MKNKFNDFAILKEKKGLFLFFILTSLKDQNILLKKYYPQDGLGKVL